MKLIAILFSLAIERFWSPIANWRRADWFIGFVVKARARMPSAIWDGPVGVLVLILPFVAIVGWLQNELMAGFFNIFGLLFSIFILVACIGPNDLGAQVIDYLNAKERNDEIALQRHASEIMGLNVPDDSTAVTWRIIHIILERANDWLLGVIFWFMILGPMGAVLYRLSSHLKQYCAVQEASSTPSGFTAAAYNLQEILDWIPSRLTALGYAISGSFVEALSNWRNKAWDMRASASAVLVSAGLGALRLDYSEQIPTDQHIHEAMELVRRTIVVALTVIALITLIGWAS